MDSFEESAAPKRAVGPRVVAARRELGLNQSELARRVGVPLYVIERYEAGGVERVPAEHLNAIARVTGKPLSFFENDKDGVPQEGESVARLRAELEQLRTEVDEIRGRFEELVHEGTEADELSGRVNELEQSFRDVLTRLGAAGQVQAARRALFKRPSS